MPGLSWLLFKGAFKMTAKGAVVTLSSTVFSCTLACYIEIGAHRMVYHYFPHKYANVEQANGITQEQLDVVRASNLEADDGCKTHRHEIGSSEPNLPQNNAVVWSSESVLRNPAEVSLQYSKSLKGEMEESNKFWMNEQNTTETPPKKSDSRSNLRSFTENAFLFRSNDVTACAMTC